MLDIKEYESMAMLDLPDGEREALNRCFDGLVESFKAIERVSADGVQPLVSVLTLHNVMREDIAVKLLTRDEILANAPEEYDGYFRVPGTLA